MATFGQTALQNGIHAAIVSAARQNDVHIEINEFASTQELNGFQKFIFEHYEFTPPELPFEVKSIIIAAAPHPSYGEAVFAYSGSEYRLYCVAGSEDTTTHDYVTETITSTGFNIKPTGFWFPFKRFAVQSGLCVYGRNNVTYLPGFGSYMALSAYYTDMPADEDTWRSVVTAPQCENCGICEKLCPTGAIKSGEFVIDSTLCLAGMNEGPEEFPPFVPKTAHHTLFDCMRCQYSCPMNGPFKANTYPTVFFDETETERLLSGAPYDDLEGELAEKYKQLCMQYTGNLPRNLRVCFDLIDSGEELSLC